MVADGRVTSSRIHFGEPRFGRNEDVLADAFDVVNASIGKADEDARR